MSFFFASSLERSLKKWLRVLALTAYTIKIRPAFTPGKQKKRSWQLRQERIKHMDKDYEPCLYYKK